MDQGTKAFFQERKEENAENTRCVDCGCAHPQWASVNLGCYFCLLCSGQHRGLGVHISFVRSITMDTWSDKQKASMKLGGNARLKRVLLEHGVNPESKISEKYGTKGAEWYRQTLRAEVHGEPAPAPLAPGEGILPAFEPKREAPVVTSLSGGGPPPPQDDGTAANSDDLFGNATASLWSFAGAAQSFAQKAKETASQKLEQAEIPQDSGGWWSAMQTGLSKAKEASAKAYETVTDEHFIDSVKQRTAEGLEKSKEYGKIAVQQGKAYAEFAQEVAKAKYEEFETHSRESGFGEGLILPSGPAGTERGGSSSVSGPGANLSGAEASGGASASSANLLNGATSLFGGPSGSGGMPPPSSEPLPDPTSSASTTTRTAPTGDAFGSAFDADMDFLNAGQTPASSAATSVSSSQPPAPPAPSSSTGAPLSMNSSGGAPLTYSGTTSTAPPLVSEGGKKAADLFDLDDLDLGAPTSAVGSSTSSTAPTVLPAAASGGKGAEPVAAKKDDWLDDFTDF
ncbi:unnamed protein product [Amoebophrya sp. A25]|nr:unnamed protein product [Amoebophrya sp. A25]|eukprot:GSA25T00022925001.1